MAANDTADITHETVTYPVFSTVQLNMITSPLDGAAAMSSGNGLVGTGFHLSTGSDPERVFKGPMDRCKATTPSLSH